MNQIKPQKSAVPVLTLDVDKRSGQTESGWALFQTHSEFYYIANDDPEKIEYVIPIDPELRKELGKIARRSEVDDTILDGLENAMTGSDDTEERDLSPEEIAEDIIDLAPTTDKVFGAGPTAVGLMSAGGIPYIMIGGHCLLFEAPPFVEALKKLNGIHAQIRLEASASADLSFVITNGEIELHFHLTHTGVHTRKDPKTTTLHVTPHGIYA